MRTWCRRVRCLVLFRTVIFGVLWLAAVGCDFPFPTKKYSAPAFDPESEGGRRLVAAFAQDDASCSKSLIKRCHMPLARCALSPACVEFAECVRREASPAAEANCTAELGTSLEDHWAFEFTRHCWADGYADCDVGRNFDCVGAYNLPTAAGGSVTVSQQLLLKGEIPEESADFSVSFCPRERLECSEPSFSGSPDPESHIYTQELPVIDGNFGGGHIWDGYRLVTGPFVDDSIVASNLPFWGRKVDITRLLSRQSIAGLSELYHSEAKNAVFVQVVDCQSDPAPGIWIELPDSPDVIIKYVHEIDGEHLGPTAPGGSIGFFGHELNIRQTIRAMRQGTHGKETVAKYTGTLSAGRPHYLRLFPTMTQQD